MNTLINISGIKSFRATLVANLHVTNFILQDMLGWPRQYTFIIEINIFEGLSCNTLVKELKT